MSLHSQRSSPQLDQTRESAADEEIPVKIVDGLVIVEVGVDGVQRPLRLLLDTGAPTLIRPDVLATIQFSQDESWKTKSATDAFGRPLELEAILLNQISIGSMNFNEIPAVVLDTPVFDLFCPPIDGLLGNNGASTAPGFLERVAVEINHDRSSIRLFKGSAHREYGGSLLPMRNYSVSATGTKEYASTPTVPILVDGTVFWAELDTGAGGLSEMAIDVFRSLGRTTEDEGVREFRGVDTVAAGGPGPQTRNWIATIDDVQFGGWSLGSVPFRIVHPPEGKRFDLRIHQDILRRFNFLLDSRNSEMRLEAREPSVVVPKLATQMMWGRQNGLIVAVGLLEGGAVQSAGVQLGDEIVAVGNLAATAGDTDSICAARIEMRRTSNAPIRLRLRREGKEFTIMLPREEPFGTVSESPTSRVE